MARRNKQIKKKQVKIIKKKIQIEKTTTNPIADFYFKNYKIFLLIPIFLLIASLAIIGLKISQDGDFVNKGVSLSGGLSLTINTDALQLEDIKDTINQEFNQPDFEIRRITSQGKQIALVIESAEIDATELTSLLKRQYSLVQDDFAIATTSSALGERFFKQTGTALIFSLIFMGLVVFLYFRSIIPSIAIILAAVSDIIMTLAVFNLLGLKLTTAGIAAFLMLIGYSVDTDILLSTRVLKRKEGTVNERILSAMSTGFMMNITTLTAITVALIFSQSQILTQIMTILFIGLIFDMINTWIQNVGILKLYLDKGGRK